MVTDHCLCRWLRGYLETLGVRLETDLPSPWGLRTPVLHGDPWGSYHPCPGGSPVLARSFPGKGLPFCWLLAVCTPRAWTVPSLREPQHSLPA